MAIGKMPLLVNVTPAIHHVRPVLDLMTTIELVDLQTTIYSLKAIHTQANVSWKPAQ